MRLTYPALGRSTEFPYLVDAKYADTEETFSTGQVHLFKFCRALNVGEIHILFLPDLRIIQLVVQVPQAACPLPHEGLYTNFDYPTAHTRTRSQQRNHNRNFFLDSNYGAL